MTIPFASIPSNWRPPLYWVEVDGSKAGSPVNRAPALVIGTRLTGIAASDVVIGVSSEDDADAYWGKGSQVARMVKAFFANNRTQTVYAIGVAEPAAGVAATGTITVSSAPTANGTLNLYIAGQRTQISISSTDSVNQVATKINAAINANTELPVTSTVNAAVVTLTCRWKGASGNDIKVGDSVLGLDGGERLPTGLALTYVAMASGSASPTLTGAIAAMEDDDYKFCAMPFTDTTSLDLFATEYGFGDTGRWGFIRQLYGAVYTAVRDTYANLLTAGPTRNDPTITRMAIEPGVQSPVWEVAAAYAAKAAKGFTNDPARPLQTLPLDGIVPAARSSRFTKTEINALNLVGLAIQSVNASGVMAIMRESTSYQKNSFSVADDAFELLTTHYTLSTLLERQRHAITTMFPRHKLAADGTRFAPGSAIVTPKMIKGALIAQYAEDEWRGLVENVRDFIANLIVEIDPDNPTRVNVLYPPDLVNGMRMFAVLAQFRLAYSRAAMAA